MHDINTRLRFTLGQETRSRVLEHVIRDAG
jgi:hypothetical protein